MGPGDTVQGPGQSAVRRQFVGVAHGEYSLILGSAVKADIPQSVIIEIDIPRHRIAGILAQERRRVETVDRIGVRRRGGARHGTGNIAAGQIGKIGAAYSGQ